jgi:hypothetical protein
MADTPTQKVLNQCETNNEETSDATDEDKYKSAIRKAIELAEFNAISSGVDMNDAIDDCNECCLGIITSDDTKESQAKQIQQQFDNMKTLLQNITSCQLIATMEFRTQYIYNSVGTSNNEKIRKKIFKKYKSMIPVISKIRAEQRLNSIH